MQIRLSRDLAECARADRTPMMVDEFLARFPEVPRDLRDEPVLGEYVRAFGDTGGRIARDLNRRSGRFAIT